MSRRRRRKQQEQEEETARMAKAVEVEKKVDDQLEQSREILSEARNVGGAAAEWERQNNIREMLAESFVGHGIVELIREKLPWVQS
jgi:hypothetical protein